MRVVAGRVESGQHVTGLRVPGADLGQGLFLSRPAYSDGIGALLADEREQGRLRAA